MTNDGMPRFSALVVIFGALAASSSHAQTDAGPSDAGESDAGESDAGPACDPACNADHTAVTFCDPTGPVDGGPTLLTCSTVTGSTGSCAQLGPVDGGWGPDCVLKA